MFLLRIKIIIIISLALITVLRYLRLRIRYHNIYKFKLKMIKDYIKLSPYLRTPRGTDEAAVDNPKYVNSSMKMNYSNTFL